MDKQIKTKPKRWYQIWKSKDTDDELGAIELPPAPTLEEVAEKKAKEATSHLTHKLNNTLNTIEGQLEKVDEQNQMLLLTIGTLKENNQVLLQQIQTLSDTNKQLFAKMQASRKRERIKTIIATLSSIVALGVGVYNVLRILGVF